MIDRPQLRVTMRHRETGEETYIEVDLYVLLGVVVSLGVVWIGLLR